MIFQISGYAARERAADAIAKRLWAPLCLTNGQAAKLLVLHAEVSEGDVLPTETLDSHLLQHEQPFPAYGPAPGHP